MMIIIVAFVLPMGSCSINTTKIIDVNNQSSLLTGDHILN